MADHKSQSLYKSKHFSLEQMDQYTMHSTHFMCLPWQVWFKINLLKSLFLFDEKHSMNFKRFVGLYSKQSDARVCRFRICPSISDLINWMAPFRTIQLQMKMYFIIIINSGERSAFQHVRSRQVKNIEKRNWKNPGMAAGKKGRGIQRKSGKETEGKGEYDVCYLDVVVQSRKFCGAGRLGFTVGAGQSPSGWNALSISIKIWCRAGHVRVQ